MKLRYYLRGIGIGVIVAAAICICASFAKSDKMTDEQIKAKAKELGMTESSTLLADAAKENIPEVESTVIETESESLTESTEETTQEPTTEVKETETEPAATPTPEPTPEATPTPTPEAPKQDDNTEQFTIITVDKGNGSDTVARKLADAGLVSDAASYDKFLCANGYDRRISAGTHEIPKGASEDEIAKIICSMR